MKKIIFLLLMCLAIHGGLNGYTIRNNSQYKIRVSYDFEYWDWTGWYEIDSGNSHSKSPKSWQGNYLNIQAFKVQVYLNDNWVNAIKNTVSYPYMDKFSVYVRENLQNRGTYTIDLYYYQTNDPDRKRYDLKFHKSKDFSLTNPGY